MKADLKIFKKKFSRKIDKYYWRPEFHVITFKYSWQQQRYKSWYQLISKSCYLATKYKELVATKEEELFSYEPLAVLMKDKGLDIEGLCEKLGLRAGAFKAKMNAGCYLSMEELDRICEVFGCQAGDVMTHRKGRQPEMVRHLVDWSKVKGINRLSEAIGFSKGALSMCKSRDGKLDEVTIARMAKELGLKKEDLIRDGIGDDFPTFDDVAVEGKMSDPDVDKTLEALGLSKGVKKGLGGPASPSKK